MKQIRVVNCKNESSFESIVNGLLDCGYKIYAMKCKTFLSSYQAILYKNETHNNPQFNPEDYGLKPEFKDYLY